MIENHKYANNYDYNKAVFLMSNYNLLDNEFLLLKEDTALASPIGTLYFEYYNESKALLNLLMTKEDAIQCVIANGFYDKELAFGAAQKPQLYDYADGADTLDFLLKL